MKKVMQILITILTLLIIGMVIWFGFTKISDYFKESDSTLVSTIITACATILVGIGAVILSHNRIKSREIAERHRSAKIELYNEFNEFFYRVLSGPHEKISVDSPSEQEVIDFMSQFKHKLIFIASAGVIKAMIEFENNSGEGKTGILLYVDDLLKAMRKDVGLTTFGVNNYELIKIFLTTESRDEVNKLRR